MIAVNAATTAARVGSMTGTPRAVSANATISPPGLTKHVPAIRSISSSDPALATPTTEKCEAAGYGPLEGGDVLPPPRNRSRRLDADAT